MANIVPLGIEAVAKGVGKFNRDLGTMDRSVSGVGRGLTGMASTVNKVGGALVKFGAVAATAAVAGVGILGGAMLKLAKDAAPLQGVKTAFEELTSTIEGGSDAMLKALQDSSADMVANADLMKTFNLATQLVGQSFAEDLPKAMTSLGKVSLATGEDMGFLLDSLVRGVGRLSPMILDNLGIQVDLTKAYEDWGKENGVLVKDMDKTQQQAALMAEVMAKLEENTAGLPDVAGSAQQQFKSFEVQMKNFKDELGLALLPTISKFMNTASELAKKVLPVVVEIFENFLIPAMDRFSVVLDNLISGGLGQLPSFLDPIIEGLQNLFSAFQENAPMAQEKFQEFITWFKENVAPTLKRVVDNIGEILDRLADLWREHGDTIMDVVSIAWKVASTTIVGTIELITGLVNAFLAVLQGDWDSAWQIILDALEGFMNLALSIVGTNLEEFTAVWKGNWENFKLIVTTVWDNIITAIKEKIDAVINVVSTKFEELKQKVKDILGIGSPSKVFEGFGRSLMEGLELGILESMKSAEIALATAATNVVSPMAKMTASPVMVGSTTTRQGDNFNLNINTNAPSEDIIADFRMMQAMGDRN